jgi:hypothetical protein
VTDVMIFKIVSPKNSAKKLAFLTQNKGKLGKILIITLFFEKNANLFAEKLAKIAENCNHNIDPSLLCNKLHKSFLSYFAIRIYSGLGAIRKPEASVEAGLLGCVTWLAEKWSIISMPEKP